MALGSSAFKTEVSTQNDDNQMNFTVLSPSLLPLLWTILSVQPSPHRSECLVRPLADRQESPPLHCPGPSGAAVLNCSGGQPLLPDAGQEKGETQSQQHKEVVTVLPPGAVCIETQYGRQQSCSESHSSFEKCIMVSLVVGAW